MEVPRPEIEFEMSHTEPQALAATIEIPNLLGSRGALGVRSSR